MQAVSGPECLDGCRCASCWFASEITGEVYNPGPGDFTHIFFCTVWMFSGENAFLQALSGYRWNRAEGKL